MILTTLIKKLQQHPKKKFIYAVTGGKYLGELLVYVEQQDELYSFLSLPLMQNRLIPIDKFQFGLQERIVEIVRKIPANIYTVCCAQHKKNVEENNIAT